MGGVLMSFILRTVYCFHNLLYTTLWQVFCPSNLYTNVGGEMLQRFEKTF